MRHSPYRGLLHCAQQTFREEGLAAFYKSYWTTVRLGAQLPGQGRGLAREEGRGMGRASGRRWHCKLEPQQSCLQAGRSSPACLGWITCAASSAYPTIPALPHSWS